jgi:Glycosyl hydrolases family 25
MKRFLFAALAALLLVGCGGAHPSPPASSHPTTKAPFVCHPRLPAEGSECIRQKLEYEGVTPAAPSTPPAKASTPTASAGGAVEASLSLSFAPQCVDVSVYQRVPNFTEAGVRCVIIQANDGTYRNPLFSQQVQAAKRAHVPWGAYTFIAPGEAGAGQADIAISMSKGLGRTLGVWADAEVPGAYSEACPYTARARSASIHIYGVYSSPGLWPGYRCAGYEWPAEWGTGPAYSLAGYPSSAIKFRQWCGTCTLAGIGEVDRDEALGLLALAHPAPTRAQTIARWHRELDGKYKRRIAERAFLTRHHCRQPPWHTAVGLSGRPNGRYEHACHVELAHAAATNASIAFYHAHYHIY